MSDKWLLKGVKVVEFATFVAAPSCAKMLADWGADVIKVEPISGEGQRTVGLAYSSPATEDENPWFENENFNKKSICINVKSAEGKEAFHKLISQADVFVTNVRVGALKKIGLSYEQLKEQHPGLVFAQILGYGEKGPLKDKPGFDYTSYFARGGVMASLMEKDTSPLNGAAGFGDHYSGIALAAGTCAALVNKARTGKGEKVTVSLYHMGIYGLGCMIFSDQYGNKMPMTRLSPNSPVCNSYQCKDGRWIQLALIQYDQWIGRFFKAIKREELINDDRYNTRTGMVQHVEEMVSMVAEAMLEKTLDEWEETLLEYDVPFERVQRCEDIVKDEQAWANDYLVKKTYDSGNEGILINTPVKFGEMGIREMTPAPRITENTDEILTAIGYSNEKIEEMKEIKAVR
ncbi:CaiB/BaiF CoA transferase family protein [Marinisporobacter balticus]|uniref:(R)-2-hydroxyisocaproate CoA-transferase n=1 Tax=Marinisporobacter balticus TaxID=2018667 RepID=A0A4R2KUA5_9FIRM|nr:CoA transferase [Marinisporobacter balticus]TCO77383.1 (R)-2-hydroxyisocaproate CoA-transferase [Marinisporobacter balticus]